MRHVSVAELKIDAEELIAAVEAGEEVAVTRDGRDVVRLTLVPSMPIADARTPEQKERQRQAVDAAWALGQHILQTRGPTTSAEIRTWIEEGRP